MMSRVLVCIALLLAADPMEGCKKLRAKAQGKDIAEADPVQTAQIASAAPNAWVSPPGSAPRAPIASNTPPVGDSLLTLGTGEWFAYGPDGPRFAVLMPQRPQESLRPVNLGGVNLSAKQGTASRVGVIYTMMFFDLPPSVRLDPQQGFRATLDAVRDDAIRGLPGAVLKGERQILLGKNPGREFQAESNTQFAMLLTAHIYLAGRRVYEQLITVPSSVGEGSTYVDKFFGSLNAGVDGVGVPMSDVPSAADPGQPPPDPVPSAKPPKKKR
jgi:hypothetical protein